jgi:hypothetical protein
LSGQNFSIQITSNHVEPPTHFGKVFGKAERGERESKGDVANPKLAAWAEGDCDINAEVGVSPAAVSRCSCMLSRRVALVVVVMDGE